MQGGTWLTVPRPLLLLMIHRDGRLGRRILPWQLISSILHESCGFYHFGCILQELPCKSGLNRSLFSLKGKMNMIIGGGWFPLSYDPRRGPFSGASALNGPSDELAFSERQNKITHENLPWDLISCGCHFQKQADVTGMYFNFHFIPN